MLAIARALMGRPRLLLLDEPSLGLAPLIVKQIFNAIAELNRDQRITVFLVEQNAFHALKLAHRGYVMVNGQITMQRHRPRTAGAAGSARRLSRGRPLMAGFLWADSDFGLLAFIILDVLGAAAAFATGRALASGWGPRWRIVPAMIALAAAVQFLHFALFQEDLLSPHYYLVTFALLLIAAWVGYREDAGATDGDAIFLGLRTGRPDLAGALTSIEAAGEKSPAARGGR